MFSWLSWYWTSSVDVPCSQQKASKLPGTSAQTNPALESVCDCSRIHYLCMEFFRILSNVTWLNRLRGSCSNARVGAGGKPCHLLSPRHYHCSLIGPSCCDRCDGRAHLTLRAIRTNRQRAHISRLTPATAAVCA
eukprot:364722-Chlamydomonas_euryale.AAC.6